MSEKISDLKQGDNLYCITGFDIYRYKYLCVHPTGGGKYHILINGLTQEPVRVIDIAIDCMELARADERQKLKKQVCTCCLERIFKEATNEK